MVWWVCMVYEDDNIIGFVIRKVRYGGLFAW